VRKRVATGRRVPFTHRCTVLRLTPSAAATSRVVARGSTLTRAVCSTTVGLGREVGHP
jgi:hypothetical protein